MFNSNIVLQTIGKPASKAESVKKAWSIPVETVLVPFAIMANASGNAQIDRSALGTPTRLMRDKDTGEVKINSKGKLTVIVAKPIRELANNMREQFIAGLNEQTTAYKAEYAELYNAELVNCLEAGKPVKANDIVSQMAYDKALAKLKAEAEAKIAEAEASQPEANDIVSQMAYAIDKRLAKLKAEAEASQPEAEASEASQPASELIPA